MREFLHWAVDYVGTVPFWISTGSHLAAYLGGVYLGWVLRDHRP